MAMEKNYRAELTGVFGDPVDGNPSGGMEEAAYAALGLNSRYLTMKVAAGDLEAAMNGAKAVGMRGVNLTMPHKVRILPLLDKLTPAAKIIGAVNTVINDGGVLTGENTDGKGFVRALELEGVSLQGRTVTILGAGGAARAIAVECALAGGASITVVNRDPGRGQELADLIAQKTPARSAYQPWNGTAAIPAGTQILIQATSLGLGTREKPDVDYDAITADMVVSDVIFNPVMPAFLEEAAARGAKTVTGIGMLVQQGALNFELWTGQKAPVDVMYRTLAAEFG